MFRLSVVTVCYNPPLINLENTISSVIDNILSTGNFARLEYVIIDGGSTNGALEIINNIKGSNPSLSIKVVSEPDSGIYDAMNKGIIHSEADWLIFMNVGDSFVKSTILKNSIPLLDDNKTVVYGDMINRDMLVKAHAETFLHKGIIMACHQSMFFNKKLLGRELNYDLKYSIYADYELIVRILQCFEGSMFYLDSPIAIYEGGGISDKVSTKKRLDKYCILYKYYGVEGVVRGIIHSLVSKFYRNR
ncbi:glycosyltransferase [Aeromonas veronii]|uniref:glycosyltransferase n=1 Tax=Aeromonas veronii TaxID=654 RepID=UPI003670F8A4